MAQDQVLVVHQPRDLALSPHPHRLPLAMDLLRLNLVLMSQPHNQCCHSLIRRALAQQLSQLDPMSRLRLWPPQ